eukprot:m.61450 g.61450  ORF g.61450 m.61450 type:complete len:499 (+) comp11866_c1_seq2:62-1558(+)
MKALVCVLALGAVLVASATAECTYGAWGEWSDCGVTCVSRDVTALPMQRRTRTLSFGNETCDPVVVETQDCVLPTCPEPALEVNEGNLILTVDTRKDVKVKVGAADAFGLSGVASTAYKARDDLAQEVTARVEAVGELAASIEVHGDAINSLEGSVLQNSEALTTTVSESISALQDEVASGQASISAAVIAGDDSLETTINAVSSDLTELTRTARDVDQVCSDSADTCTAADQTQRLLAQSAALDTAEARVAQLEQIVLELELASQSAQLQADTLSTQSLLQDTLAASTTASNARSSSLYQQISAQASANFASVGAGQTTPTLTRQQMNAKLTSLENMMSGLENPRIRDCSYSHLNQDCDTCVVMNCAFTKQFDHTVIRLTFTGNARFISHGSRAHWWLEVDEKPCIPHDGDPNNGGGIDASLHQTSNYDNHRIMTIFGFCDRLAGGGTIRAGQHNVRLRLKTDANNAYTGWQSSSRIIIEEFPPGDHRVCSSLDCGL